MVTMPFKFKLPYWEGVVSQFPACTLFSHSEALVLPQIVADANLLVVFVVLIVMQIIEQLVVIISDVISARKLLTLAQFVL